MQQYFGNYQIYRLWAPSKHAFHVDKDIKKLANEFTRLISNYIGKEIKITGNAPGT